MTVSQAQKAPRHDEALRGRLMEVAGRILSAEGPAALSLRRIAAEAGTSTTAIYTLFGSKEELVRSICREGAARLSAATAEVEPTDDPVADVEELGRAYRRWALADPATYQVIFGNPLPGFELSEEDKEEARRSLRDVQRAVARCIDGGRYAAADPTDVAHRLWGLVHGLVSLELTDRAEPGVDAEQQFERALAMASRGLAAGESRR